MTLVKHYAMKWNKTVAGMWWAAVKLLELQTGP